MSIILKGIDLPKEGEVKFIAIKGKTAIETHKGINIGYHEVVQIPKGHGRLIDGDKIVKEYYKKPTYLHLCTLLNNAPTILEAEEK